MSTASQRGANVRDEKRQYGHGMIDKAAFMFIQWRFLFAY